jgi:hypothetical protein
MHASNDYTKSSLMICTLMMITKNEPIAFLYFSRQLLFLFVGINYLNQIDKGQSAKQKAYTTLINIVKAIIH